MSLQVSILVGELSSQFCDIKQQIDDPFLVCRVHVATCIVNEYSHKSNVHAFVCYSLLESTEEQDPTQVSVLCYEAMISVVL